MRETLLPGGWTAREPAPPPPPAKFYLGLDLGQASDYSALAVVRRVQPGAVGAEPPPSRHECVGLKRYQLGTSYPDVVTDVKEILEGEALRGAETTLSIDETGVGRPVFDMFKRAGLNPVAITITAGNQVVRDGRDYHVPKRDLVSALQVLLQSERLKIAAALPHAETLRRELQNFKVKVTLAANDTYGAWRDGEHDDLVLALALACWSGENVRARRHVFLAW